MKLVECVPNFSEGRDRARIDAIAAAIRATAGVELLDVDPGADTNRTVVTLLGPPEAVLEAAFAGVARAAELIDMRTHSGAHARMGATDVVPFVPVRGVGMEECVELARRLGARVAKELGIPVYLYEEAATRPGRRNLATVRQGEYEGLADKLRDPAWAPDFGEARFNAKSGATVIGARELLIAYNFNLNTRDRRIATDIALEIREQGRSKRGEDGRFVRDEQGEVVARPGLFRHVKATGWFMEQFDCAQVTMNLTNYKETPLGEVFDAVCRLADERGVRCTGSELVGLVPRDCLLEAGRHYLRKSGKSAGVPEKELIRLAVQSLGLSELSPFDAQAKIVESRIPDPRPLISQSLADFVHETSTDSPAPGGGSVAALCGSLSAALSGMVALLTVGKKGHEKAQDEMKALAETAQPLKDACLRAIDDDTAAFNDVMAAIRLPKATPDEARARHDAVVAATKRATEVPLDVLKRMPEALDLAEAAAARGNRNSLSDAGVASLAAKAAAEGAWYNVLINLATLEDEGYRERVLSEGRDAITSVRERADALASSIEQRLLRPLARDSEA
jgi:glutamate formiminotransferase/formiminotetrahydrofolate cyclodeaminase